MVHWALVALLLAGASAPAPVRRASFAERLGIAYWVTVQHFDHIDSRIELGKSPGLSLEIASPPAGLHAELLFGTRSGGAGIFTRDFQGKRMRWSFGVGGVTKWQSSGEWTPFIGMTIKFWAQCRCDS